LSISILLHPRFPFTRSTTITNSSKLLVKTDTESPEPEQDNVLENLWTHVERLQIQDLVNAINQIVLDDFQYLADVAKDQPLNLETFTLLCKEFIKTHTGCAILTTVAVVVCIIILVYPMAVASPFLAGLGFTNAGPAAGKTSDL
jgi:hypothetical protein